MNIQILRLIMKSWRGFEGCWLGIETEEPTVFHYGFVKFFCEHNYQQLNNNKITGYLGGVWHGK